MHPDQKPKTVSSGSILCVTSDCPSSLDIFLTLLGKRSLVHLVESLFYNITACSVISLDSHSQNARIEIYRRWAYEARTSHQTSVPAGHQITHPTLFLRLLAPKVHIFNGTILHTLIKLIDTGPPL
jgi:hypothetical protein